MSYYVYILYSSTADTFYKGQTEDIKNRLQQHNSGFEIATARYVPWQLIWYTEKQNRSEALLLETKLKNLSRERTLKFMLKYNAGIAGPDELFLIKQLSGC
jgi:putative endonuclease